MKSKIQYDFRYSIATPHVDLESIPNIFYVEKRKSCLEVYSSIAEKYEVVALLKTLKPNFVSYTEMLSQNVELPDGFLKKPKLEKDTPEDFGEKLLYSKLENPLHLEKDKALLANVIHLPKINPQKFKELCDILKDENSKESYYNDNLKNHFPYHPGPYAFQLKDDVFFSMQFRRNILRTNKFYTNVIISASYDPRKGDFLDRAFSLVHDSMGFLLGKHNALKFE